MHVLQSNILAQFVQTSAEGSENMKETTAFSSVLVCYNRNEMALVCDLL